ncbi:hypothetical protein GH714_012038 [Hevea brasiliensis]|uniref:Uncharacterized protein n=1 Tax=Hevea brasiliensis TaxID=3981 RepID=A0A6A6MTI0_HEVBR|nr:hypothetical protein GH714_012038 [Hevea brasiliensis]
MVDTPMSDTSQKAHEDWNADVNISALASEVMKLIKGKTVENEPISVNTADFAVNTSSNSQASPNSSLSGSNLPLTQSPTISPELTLKESFCPSSHVSPISSPTSPHVQLRRSTRTISKPAWLQDFVAHVQQPSFVSHSIDTDCIPAETPAMGRIGMTLMDFSV